jgi:hypothetical protein
MLDEVMLAFPELTVISVHLEEVKRRHLRENAIDTLKRRAD